MTLKAAKLLVWSSIIERAAHPVKARNHFGCKYRVDRDPDNVSPKNCCFIGIGITPEQYEECSEIIETSIEDTAPYHAYLNSFGIELTPRLSVTFKNWLRRVQRVYDMHDIDDWPEELKKLAPK